ncbi:hypothetical protein WG922_12125 [Ramlibacter sp. AN1015]|uniref:hypothetical protein n=1 Tax=Ramlibacter sp. AN1015 TaxID=3133428 RepID=UPI0030BFE415
MTITHPDEFGRVEERLLESAIDSTEGQFLEAERIVSQRFPTATGDMKAQLVTSVAQVIATNYVAAATIRNLPKG